MQRVLVVGPCGAGKSTLAFALAQRTGLPLVHMDRLNWQPGWVETPKAELRERVRAVAAGERWLIEGTYGGTLAERLERADTVIYLDYPVTLCLARLLRRIFRYRGRARPDMTEGCPERLDLAFLWYVATWNLGPKRRLEQKLAGDEGMIVRLAGPAATRRWLDGIRSGPAVDQPYS